jgi:hypothetical protein
MADKSLRDRIVAKIPARRTGFQPWYERTPPDVMAELEQLRAAWRAGEIESPKITLARAISQTLAEMGVIVGPQGVVHWLRNP